MLTLKKQLTPAAPIAVEFSLLSAISAQIRRARRNASICLFLRLNPLRARNRRLLRFL